MFRIASLPGYRLLVVAAFLLVRGAMAGGTGDSLAYLNPSLPLDIRVRDLVSRLTPEEKTGQLISHPTAIPRLGIASYDYWNEGLHGVLAPGMTSFPQVIALSATWDTSLIRRVAGAISDEARAWHKRDGTGLNYWSPVINMVRDPRWGRTEEAWGEDTFLTSEMASAFIRGMQGNDPKYLKTAATVKHFSCYSVEEGRHHLSAAVDERSLREYYLPAFGTCVKQARATSVMSAYNAVNGVPCPVNRTLLTHILREEWGFQGSVVSDCDAVMDVFTGHGYTNCPEEAVALAIHSGTDMNCGETYRFYSDEALGRGILTMDEIDTALTRIFRTRFLLGEFDPPGTVPYDTIPISRIDCQEHRQLAVETARKAIVLLRNRNGILPINRDSVSRIAVIGPNAGLVQLGVYSSFPNVMITPLQGILDHYHGPGHSLQFAAGCSLTGPPDSVLFAAAVSVASWAQVVIFVGGTDPEEAKEEHDRTGLGLPGAQDSLLHLLIQANPHTVAVVVSGFPVAISRADEEVPGILAAWYDGQAQGTAIADVLFGDYNPGGKISSTWYRSVNDLPPMDHYNIRGNRTYRYFTGDPLYPFGYGLSYTTFSYESLTVSKPLLGPLDSVIIKVVVRNSGTREGEEVVQLYVHSEDSLVLPPLQELKGFRRIALQPGAADTVYFTLRHGDLAYFDEKRRKYSVRGGFAELRAGSSSADIRLAKRISVTGADAGSAFTQNPFVPVMAENFDRKSVGASLAAITQGGKSVLLPNDSAFIMFRNFDFREGAGRIWLNLAADSLLSSSALEIELFPDSLTGVPAGTVSISNEGSGTGYRVLSSEVDIPAGIHDLFFVLHKKNAGSCSIDRFSFSDNLATETSLPKCSRIYPNPASTEVTVEFDQALRGPATATVTDLTGRVVSEIREVSPVTGRFRAVFDISGIQSGLYLISVNAGGRHISGKLAVVRP